MAHLPIWTPLASALLAMAWLLPNSSPPWGAFHKDAWAAMILLLVGAVYVFKKTPATHKFSLDVFSAALALLGALTIVQWGVGTIHFAGHAVVGAGYLLAASVAVMIGKEWERTSHGAPGDFLFVAFLLASFGTAGLMLVQWLGVEANDVWVSSVAPNGRPYGNLMQPNNAATLLLLGMVSIFWFNYRKKLNPAIAFVGALFLLFFVVLTGSRIGYLSFVSLTLLTLGLGLRHAELGRARIALGLLLLVLPLLVFFATHDWAGPQSIPGAGPKLAERPLVSLRASIYQAYVEAVLVGPWWGYGFRQGVLAQLTAAGLGYELPGLASWMHNAFLDIAVWFGLPAAAALIGSILVIFLQLIRTPFNSTRMVYFMGAYVVFMHAMVELPHGYAYFLLPICMLAGAMLSGLSLPSIAVPKAVVRGVLFGLGVLLLLVVQDYLRVESAFYAWRFKQANIGRVHAREIPDTRVLNQFRALLAGLQGDADTLDDKSVMEFEHAVVLFPSAAALQRLAEVQLRRGDAAAAQNTVDRARLLAQPAERRAMAARWKHLGSQDSRFRAVVWRE